MVEKEIPFGEIIIVISSWKQNDTFQEFIVFIFIFKIQLNGNRI